MPNPQLASSRVGLARRKRVRCHHIDHVICLTLEYYSHGGRSVELVRAKIFFGPDIMHLKCANPLERWSTWWEMEGEKTASIAPILKISGPGIENSREVMCCKSLRILNTQKRQKKCGTLFPLHHHFAFRSFLGIVSCPKVIFLHKIWKNGPVDAHIKGPENGKRPEQRVNRNYFGRWS